MSQRLVLKPGVNPELAAVVLRSLADRARHASVAGHEWYQVRDAYLVWVEAVESQLSSITADFALIAGVQNEHYWRLQDLSARFARPDPMIQAELARQCERFEALAEELQQRHDLVSKAPGSIAVVDTNVLLHYQPPAQVPWPPIVGGSPVRLVIPLCVVEELDLKKWGDNKKLAARARNLLPSLQRTLGRGGRPGVLRDAVTVEVPVPSRPRHRPIDADEEILATCEELTLFSRTPAILITGDTSMTIRAEASTIPVKIMPARFERQESPAPHGTPE
jgi:hypothetical protein